MKTMVLYETFFGNTERIARAIGAALPPAAEAEVLRAADAGKEQLAGVEVLIVGSPTRAFRPTQATVKFLKDLPARSLQGVRVAAFDTRAEVEAVDSKILKFMAGVFGYAAKPIADGLTKKGGEPVLPPEGFFVTASEGPLKEGELERAAEWAKKVYRACQGK